MKDLARENAQLKRALAELTLDRQILKEALEGNFETPKPRTPASVSRAFGAKV